ncbi:hypothetical protein CSUI_005136 [Cystoisospora suis]|uniref:Transmembrane protein n=1 Tax=Cystoisospora suis TaxID=483139 RepID=A0A2C6KYQ1_9APIC|nr:hypothetical protein CSUI_005136 [Cystoisospora suis]
MSFHRLLSTQVDTFSSTERRERKKKRRGGRRRIHFFHPSRFVYRENVLFLLLQPAPLSGVHTPEEDILSISSSVRRFHRTHSFAHVSITCPIFFFFFVFSPTFSPSFSNVTYICLRIHSIGVFELVTTCMYGYTCTW